MVKGEGKIGEECEIKGKGKIEGYQRKRKGRNNTGRRVTGIRSEGRWGNLGKRYKMLNKVREECGG